MSRNAQWAALTTPTGPPPTNAPPQSTLINLATGEKFALPEAVAGSTRGASSVASDGTVVFDIGVLGPGLWKQGTFTSLPLRGPFGISAISDNAKVLVYGQLFNFPTNPQQRLIVRDLSTNVETVIFAAPDATGGAAAFGLSNNGQRLLYAVTSGPAGGPAFLADTTNGQSTPLPLPDGELAVAGTLSGNGNIAFVLTSTGRIISIDIANGYALRTLVPPTPYVPGFPTLIPGSLVRINGTLPRTVAALQGHLFMNDIALPVLYANDHEVGAQVPWELAGAAQSSFRVELPGDSPFRQNDFISTFPLLPRFEPLGAGETSIFGFKILRGDFSGLLTTNPKPGDIITAYATGLGPVIGSIPTGQPAPFDQLFPIQGQFTCTFNPYGAPAETLFAGLAPGFLGIYQINFRLPSGPDPGPITGGFCTFSGAGVNGGFSWARP
jgi:uncharacterized protein (TIGR03437 family)